MPRPRSTETDSLGGQRSSFTSHGPSRNSTRRDDNTLGDGPTLPKTPLRTFSFSSGDEACGLSPIREESQHFHSPSSAIDYDAIVAAYIRAYCSRISERVKAVAGQNLKLFLRELCAKEDDAIWAVRLGYQPEDWSTEVESDELEEETNFRNLVWEHSVRHADNATGMTQNDLLKTVMRILDRQEKAKQGQGTEVVDDRDDLDYFSVFSEGESFTTMSRRESFLRRHSRALSGLIKGLSICRKLVMNQPAGLDCASASFLAIGYSTTRISVPPVVVSLCPYARNSLSTPQRAISVGPEQLSRSSDPPKPPKRKSMQKLRSGAMPQHSSMFVTPKTSHTGGSRVREPKRGPDAKHLEAELQKAAMATGLDGKELPAWPERPNHLGLREVSTTSGRTGMKVTGLRKRSTVP